MRKTTTLVLLLAAVAAPAAPVFTASNDVRIDCAHVHRQADGNWRGDARAEIYVNGSQISLANSVLSAKNMLIDGESLSAMLERQCRSVGKDAALPSANSGKSVVGTILPAQR